MLNISQVLLVRTDSNLCRKELRAHLIAPNRSSHNSLESWYICRHCCHRVFKSISHLFLCNCSVKSTKFHKQTKMSCTADFHKHPFSMNFPLFFLPCGDAITWELTARWKMFAKQMKKIKIKIKHHSSWRGHWDIRLINKYVFSYYLSILYFY